MASTEDRNEHLAAKRGAIRQVKDLARDALVASVERGTPLVANSNENNRKFIGVIVFRSYDLYAESLSYIADFMLGGEE